MTRLLPNLNTLTSQPLDPYIQTEFPYPEILSQASIKNPFLCIEHLLLMSQLSFVTGELLSPFPFQFKGYFLLVPTVCQGLCSMPGI